LRTMFAVRSAVSVLRNGWRKERRSISCRTTPSLELVGLTFLHARSSVRLGRDLRSCPERAAASASATPVETSPLINGKATQSLVIC
jgi:hypothetical protein